MPLKDPGERSPRLQVEPAVPSDATQLLTIRDAAARWQQDRGIAQWLPGELTLDHVARQIDAGRMYVVRNGEQVDAAILLLWADPTIWGDDPDDRAGYVHGLMTRHRGTGLGRELLQWAEQEVVRAGRSAVRLDCVSSNTALRDFYCRQGYIEVGVYLSPNPRWPALTTFEKNVGGVHDAVTTGVTNTPPDIVEP